MHFDVIVVGLGAMGSATLFHLVRQGARVLGIDAFDPPHTNGSSHGETRVIREAYFEHPVYVPLVQRAYELWAHLERDSGQKLYLPTGGLMIGDRASTVFSGALRSAREHCLPHEILTSEQIIERAPGLRPPGGMMAVLEPRAGILFPEKCVGAHLNLARKLGATVHVDERVILWDANYREVNLITEAGRYTSKKLVLTGGAWMPQLLPELVGTLQIERQVLLWFKAPVGGIFDAGHLPIHLWEYEPGRMFYGFPDIGDGLKVALHHEGETIFVSAASADRNVRPADVAKMRSLLARFMPAVADAEFLRGTVCFYTNTPDGHFILDRHPEHANVVVASPCSGHGFKFASAIGEALAGMALNQPPSLDLSLFEMRRFH